MTLLFKRVPVSPNNAGPAAPNHQSSNDLDCAALLSVLFFSALFWTKLNAFNDADNAPPPPFELETRLAMPKILEPDLVSCKTRERASYFLFHKLFAAAAATAKCLLVGNFVDPKRTIGLPFIMNEF